LTFPTYFLLATRLLFVRLVGSPAGLEAAQVGSELMSANADQPPAPDAWRVQNLRLIAFPSQPQFATQQHWWRELTGAEPENVLERRPKQEKEESGPLQGATLSLGIDLLRIQWTVSPRLDAENLNIMDQLPVIGPFGERKDWFRGLMERWLPHCPPINRLAFAGTLLQPVDDHPAGYRMLDRYLRWLEIDPHSSDLVYRINRPRPSTTGVAGLRINRLSTWTVAKFTVVMRVLEGAHPEQQLFPGEKFACALELDINTTPDFQGLLPSNDLTRVFAELVESGIEIATRGDARP
jgi:hypothetical protein